MPEIRFADPQFTKIVEIVNAPKPANDNAEPRPAPALGPSQSGAAASLTTTFMRSKVGALIGRAGTGKTTLLVAMRMQFPEMLILCPSNKACARVRQVLKEYGLEASGVQTVHSAVCTPTGDARAAMRGVHTAGGDDGLGLEFDPKEGQIETPVWVDEAGMLEGGLLRVLEQKCRAGLVLAGDDQQLPPIKGGPSALTLAIAKHGSVALTENFRQSDGPLKESLSRILQGEELEETLALLPKISLGDAIKLSAASGGKVPIIAGRHRTQLVPINAAVRKARGFGRGLTKGEILLVRRGGNLTKWGGHLLTTNEEVVFQKYSAHAVEFYFMNGEWGAFPPEAECWGDVFPNRPYQGMLVLQRALVTASDQEGSPQYEILLADFNGDEQQVAALLAAVNVQGYWTKENPSPVVRLQREYRDEVGRPWAAYCDAADSYARTCHSAQGSEWDYVLVVPGAQGDARKWYYTALSRAKRGAFLVDGTVA